VSTATTSGFSIGGSGSPDGNVDTVSIIDLEQAPEAQARNV